MVDGEWAFFESGFEGEYLNMMEKEVGHKTELADCYLYASDIHHKSLFALNQAVYKHINGNVITKRLGQ